MSASTASSVPVGIAGTTLAHGALLMLAWALAHRAPPRPNPIFAVELIAAPLPAEAPRRAAAEAVPTKTEETVAIKPKPKPVPPPKKEPPKPAANAKPASTPPPVTKTVATPAPGEAPSTGQDATTLVRPGLNFPFPGYIEKIYNVIAMRWQRPINSPLRAEIDFTILQDGSVTGISVRKSSGNSLFDNSAKAAIEAAGNARAFGPLPAGFNGTELPITFGFTPSPRPPQ